MTKSVTSAVVITLYTLNLCLTIDIINEVSTVTIYIQTMLYHYNQICHEFFVKKTYFFAYFLLCIEILKIIFFPEVYDTIYFGK